MWKISLRRVFQGETTRTIQSSSRRNKASTRITLERLEDRLAPATLPLVTDPTFGNGGQVTTRINNVSDDLVHGMVEQPDGKLVVVGRSYDGKTSQFALARFNTDGSLDPSFASGTVVTAVGSGAVAEAVALQADGKIVVAGYTFSGGFTVARYNSDGSLDMAFGSGGTVVTRVGGNDSAAGVAVQPDGKIVVAGSSDVLSQIGNVVDRGFSLVRYNSDGSLDTGFGSGGEVLTDFGPTPGFATFSSYHPTYANANGVALQPDGRILVAGYFLSSTNDIGNVAEAFLLARYSASGLLENSPSIYFGSSGPIGSQPAVGTSLVVQPDGQVVEAGYSAGQFALVRFNGSDLSLDTSFGNGGKVTTAVGSTDAQGDAVVLDALGRIVVAGSAVVGKEDFALARYHSDGSLDISPNGNGTFTIAIGSSNDDGSAVVVQSDGKIVIAGSSNIGGDNEFALVRLIASDLVVPTARDDNYAVDENGTLTVAAPGVLATDSDPAGLPLTAHLVSAPTNGSLTLNSDGSFTYTPTTGFFGTDSFTYVANNGTVDSNIATVTLTVDQQGVVVNTDDDGPGSLRQAIRDTNANPGPDTITFDIPGPGVHTINVLSPLPYITDSVTIDGYSQPGASGNTNSFGQADNAVLKVELNGSAAGNAYGLVVGAPDSTVRGLVINRFDTGIFIGSSNDWIYGNFIGVDPTGMVNEGNATGVAVVANNLTIGSKNDGHDALERNVISANVGNSNNHDISVKDHSTAVTIQGNYVGTDATGSAQFDSASNGDINIRAENSSNLNIIGNVVSGSAYIEIHLVGDTDVTIQSNRIGTTADGTQALGNPNGFGILTEYSANFLIGGVDTNTPGAALAGAGNLISGSGIGLEIENGPNFTLEGNYVGTDITGSNAIPNLSDGMGVDRCQNVTIGGVTTGTGNLVSGNGRRGIAIAETAGPVLIEGNTIGTDATGKYAIGNAWSGVDIGASGVTVGGATQAARNLVSGNGGGILDTGTGNLIEGNYVGTDSSGTEPVPNGSGVALGGVSNRVINNLVSGNNGYGISLGGTLCVVQGNMIGTDVTGTVALGNGGANIDVSNSSNLNILDNVISGGAYFGIDLYPNVNNVTIQGNKIGTTADGMAALGNTYGIYMIDGIHDITIGGTSSGAGNLISGNFGNGLSVASPDCYDITVQGNFVGTDLTGTYAIPNDGHGIAMTGTNLQIGGTDPGAGNLVSGNLQDGIVISDTTGPVHIEGNTVGTDINGSYAIGNGNGIFVSGAISGVTVGGTTAAARNLISGSSGSGNTGTGLAVGGNNNLVEGNYIGTDKWGLVPIPNTVGVNLGGSNNQLVANLISGNGVYGGVYLYGASNDTLQDNLIGTDVTGNKALPNQGPGVNVTASNSANKIGTPGHGNVISGNAGGGIYMQNPDNSGNTVAGNFIGTNARGTSTTGTNGKPLGNANWGVLIYQGHDNTIGGAAPGARNVISGNLGFGVGIEIPTATGNIVQGNLIGTDVTGTLAFDANNNSFGNTSVGVAVVDVNSAIIGGVAAGAANTIANNGSNGVQLISANSVSIRGNSIHDNGGLAIDLGTAGNNEQTYPVLTGALAGATTSVSGTLSSAPNSTFSLDFYANAAADPSGYGEGQRYLGSATVTTDASGNATFVATGLGATGRGETISATATDAAGDTSQFAADIPALAPTTAAISAPTITYGAPGVITVTVASVFGTPIGNVSLTVDSGSPITQALVNGSSTFTVSGLSAGDHALSATYAAQGYYAASTATGSIHVNPTRPTLSVTPSAGSVAVGNTPTILKATADLEGGYQPTGTIRFTLRDPNGVLVDTETAPVNGDGAYTTPTGYTLSQATSVAGAYVWDASYGGDSGNNSASVPLPQRTFTVLGTFGYSSTGDLPETGLLEDSNGNLFGTTTGGGTHGSGTVFEVVAGSNTVTPLASFDGSMTGTNPTGRMAMDSQGDLFGTTLGGGANNAGTVFEFIARSGTIVPLAAFSLNTTGQSAVGGLVRDGQGDLFGTTQEGGADGYGTVFEVVAGSNTITPLASFDGQTTGADPYGELTLDQTGDLFGTTLAGGPSYYGTVFEVVAGSSTITRLAAFTTGNGANPSGSVSLDSQGDLFGTTQSGGAHGDGTVFEVVAGSGSITALVSFGPSSFGGAPNSGMVMDSQGDLFGATSVGFGTQDVESLFEIAAGSHTATQLASFSHSAYEFQWPLLVDSNGNLFATTTSGGPGNVGTVFELPSGSGAITSLASFVQEQDGSSPNGGLVLDSQGNLFGTTAAGGSGNVGTVFEIQAGSDTATTLASFDYNSTGGNPFGGLVMDRQGDLFGTTSSGGAYGTGTVFEVAAGSDAITTLALFDNSTTGGSPHAGLVMDSQGDLFGCTTSGGAYGYGTVFEMVAASDTITPLAPFDYPTTGIGSTAGLVMDSQGDLFGTANAGGAYGNGTVFEVAAGNDTITPLAYFGSLDSSSINTTGAFPAADLVMDGHGDLFGTANVGGAHGQGTVFEVMAGSGTITPLASFDGGPAGSYPLGGLLMDRQGNLYGSASGGGVNNEGALYELTADTHTLTPLFSFDAYTTGASPIGDLIQDGDGNLFGATQGGPGNDGGTVFRLSALPPPQGAVNVTVLPLSTSLVSSVTTSTYGQSVSFTVTVTIGGSPVSSGTIELLDGTANIASGSVNGNGQFSFTTTSLVTGAHTITAQFSAPGLSPSSSVVNLQVNPAQLTVMANNATMVYGTSVLPTFTDSISGFVNSENVSVVSGAASMNTTATPSSSVGSYTITVAQGTLSAANYTFVLVNGTFAITPATLTVTANNASMVYGSTVPALGGTLTGVVNNDNITASYTTTATSSSDVVNGGYAITARLNDPNGRLNNYVVISNPGTLTIVPYAFTYQIGNDRQIYGSAANLPGDLPTTISTGINGQTLNIAYSSTGDTTTADAGNYPITGALTNGTGLAADYTVTLNPGTLTVNPANQTITWANPADIGYGTALSSTQLNAVVSVVGPALAGAVTYTPAAGTVLNAGLNQTLTVNVAATTDYKAAMFTVNINVSRAALTVTVNNQTMVYGSNVPTLTGTLTGVVNNDNITASYATTATSSSDVVSGGYAITAILNDPNGRLGNYTITYRPGILTITPARQTITWANPAAIVYGTALSSTQLNAVVSVVGPASAGTVTYSPAAGTVLNAGTNQTLTVNVTATQDYNAASATVRINVTPATLTVTAGNAARDVGQQNPQFTDTITGFVNNDPPSVVSGAASLTTSATTTSPAGTYAITAAQGTLSAANYTFAFVNGTLTVYPLPTAGISGPPDGLGVAYQVRNFIVSAGGAAADLAAGFTYNITWGDGSSVQLRESAAFTTLVVSHTYTTTGTFTVAVTVTDQFGGVSPKATTTMTIGFAEVEADPSGYAGVAGLAVSGTNAAQGLVLAPGGTTNSLSVTRAGTLLGTFVPTNGNVYIYGDGGNDSLTITGVANSANTFTLSGNTATFTAASLGQNKFTIALNGIPNVTMQGGNSGNSFTNTLATVASTLIGGTGANTYAFGNTIMGAPAAIQGKGTTNTLTGLATVANAWTVNGTNAGNLNGTNWTFTGVQNLTGGSAGNTFFFVGTGSLAGSVNGGGGLNALNYTGDTLSTVAVNLNTSKATSIGATFANIGQFIGQSTASTPDTLTAASTANNWNITGVNSGTLNTFKFTNFGNLSGAGSDTFTMGPSGSLNGTLTGAATSDSLVGASLATTFTITGAGAGTLSNSSGSVAFKTIGNLTGGSSNDTLVGANTTNAWTITGKNNGTVNAFTFTNFANLTSGTGTNTFTVAAGGSLTGTLTGVANAANNNNTLVTPNALSTVTMTGNNQGNLASAGTAIIPSFTGIQNVTGGSASVYFTFSSNSASLSGNFNAVAGGGTLDYSSYNGTPSVDLQKNTATGIGGTIANVTTVNGNGPATTVTGPNAANVWYLTGIRAGNLKSGGKTITLASVGHLIGNKTSDYFHVNTDFLGSVNGGASGTLDYSGYTGLNGSAVYVNLVDGVVQGLSSVSSILSVIGRGAGDVLVGNGSGIRLEEDGGTNLIIGGTSGGATLRSLNAQDIVIAGWASYDSNDTALRTIEYYWSHYGSITGSGYTLDATTVHHSATGADTVFVGGLDWLFYKAGVDIVNGTPGKKTLIT
jgi:uncharacterized delta-60 repeat protein